jgi:hypothetical protein
LNGGNNSHTRSHNFRTLNWENSTDEERYLAYDFFSTFNHEGRWKVSWTLSWQSCDEDAFKTHPLEADMISNITTWGTWFTIQSSGSEVDLVAATVNKSCPGEYGVAIDVTDKTMEVPMWVTWSGGKYTNDTCAVVDYSIPTPTPNPCRVDIDATSVASMSASLKARLCSGIDPPDDCPEDKKNAAQQLAVVGVSCFLAAFGAMGFFLV